MEHSIRAAVFRAIIGFVGLEGDIGRRLQREVKVLALAESDAGLIQAQHAGREFRMIGRNLGEGNLGQCEDRIADVDALSTAPELPDGVSAVALSLRSWMSSCTSEKLWTSSTATAGPRASSAAPPSASQVSTTRAGRMRLPIAGDPSGEPSASSQPR